MIIPTNNNVLIKPLEREVKTSKGIILGQMATTEEGLAYGQVENPGESPYKKGDKVFYSKYSAVWLTSAEGDSYQMINHLDIMGKEE